MCYQCKESLKNKFQIIHCGMKLEKKAKCIFINVCYVKGNELFNQIKNLNTPEDFAWGTGSNSN